MTSPDHDPTRATAVAAEPETEAGIGASATNAVPENVVTSQHAAAQEQEKEQATAQETRAAPGDHPGEPEKERSKAKIAIIMFALGARIFIIPEYHQFEEEKSKWKKRTSRAGN